MGPCSAAWLRLTVARWATKQLTDEETWWFDRWREKHAKPHVPPEKRDWQHDPYNRIPPELADLFDVTRLPHPPGSETALALEIALIAISRVWWPA